MWLNKSLKSPVWEDPFDKQYGKGDQTLLKPEPHHLYHIYWSLLRQLSRKKYFLEICQILGLCVKTVFVCHNYFSLIERI